MRIKRTGRLITREGCEAIKQNLSRKFRTNNVIATHAEVNLPPVHKNVMLSGGMDPPSLNLRTIIHMNPRRIGSQQRTPANKLTGA